MRRVLLALTLVAAATMVSPVEGVRRQAAAPASVPAAAPAPSPRNANYSIDVELDPATRTLTGRAVIAWRNVTAHPASELRLHLYWNAWRDERSSWMREQRRGQQRANAMLFHVGRPRADDWAAIDLTALRLLGSGDAALVDLMPSTRFVAPDDGNSDDRTLLAVPLPQPIGPGETATLDVAWTARVPRTFARTGAIGDYYFIGHWFPKVGVLGANGWQARQFHAGTEFFADYGVYDVRITVPRGWVVGATGRERERRDTAGRTVHRYVQEDVHDFAWTASPDYLERRERFEHPGLPPVEMRLLILPEHAGQEARHFEATALALRKYGEWFGPYPYGHLTIVDTAWQSEADGMEYPTLFTAGTRWLAPEGTGDPEAVTVHETGHQFLYGLVATNEVEHAWLDEGLNSYAEARAMFEAWPRQPLVLRFFGGFVPWVVEEALGTRDVHGNGMPGYRRHAESDVPATPSWRYFPGTGTRITYAKTALWLHTLERHIGWERMQRGLSRYFERHRFGHPEPDDLFAALSEAAGRDLTPFFDQVYRSSHVFDYAVGQLTTTPAEPRAPGDDADGAGGEGEPLWRTEVVVRRLGEAVFPVDVLVTFEDGTTARERWNGRDRWTLLTFERPSPALSAEVDPDHVLVLDVNRTNNSETRRPQAAEASRQWAGRWWIWVQDLALTYAFFL
jgi:hypothetical protein